MSCSFRIETEVTCENKTLEEKVRLVGKEVIPFVAGQTVVWMYLDSAGNSSRYNLSYDSAAGAYLASVPGVCEPAELTVYGRVGERSAVQTVRVECGACGDAAVAAEAQGSLSISGRVFNDSNGDGVRSADEAGLEGWDVLLMRPDGGSSAAKTDRKGYYIFTGLPPGAYRAVAVAQENWTATTPPEGVQKTELVDIHESEENFGFMSQQTKNLPSEMIEFNKTFGGSGGIGWAYSVQQTSDGGYILAGEMNADAYLINQC
jgi:hypothetical protein